jgi:flagellar motor protein MotB
VRSQFTLFVAAAAIFSGVGWSQSEPLYRVTVVQRSVRAVNYQYRSGPTSIDFAGTVLLPQAKGDATVESKEGRTEIDAHFEHVAPPTRFGPEYLTYVLWAVTPEGHAKNLGEVLANSSDKAHLHVTTDLQAFGLIVTAEPYSAVRLPSDVVVMQNEIRPDTIGTIQPIEVRYDLMPRGSYTYHVPSDLKAAENSGPKVSMGEYQELVELYQAQNALQIAASQGADQYAPDIMAQARQDYENARAMHEHNGDRSRLISDAREAAQTAEDARIVTMRRKQEAQVTEARSQADRQKELRLQAEAEAQHARAQAQQAQAQADSARQELAAERTAHEQAEQQRAAAAAVPPPPPPPARQSADRLQSQEQNQTKKNLRVSLMQQFNQDLVTRDTPRGLVITIPNSEIHGGTLTSDAAAGVETVARVIAAHPGLTVTVEGNSDAAGAAGETSSRQAATAVRDALVRDGVPASAVEARGLGNSRPIVSDATASGRDQNRRVEIVVSGGPIGDMAYWEQPYTIKPQQ